MEIKNIKIKNCSLNIGELHSLIDYEHISPVFVCEDEHQNVFEASMRLHISEPLEGLVFADPRKFVDEGLGINSVGSKVIFRKESFKDNLPLNVLINENELNDVTLYKLDAESLKTALLSGYNFEEEKKKYLASDHKKNEIAFTCHDPNIIGGGNVILFRIINWLNDLGIKVTVYSCGTPPSWNKVNAVFKCFKTYKEMFASIEEQIVVIYSMWHIEPVMKANPNGKLIYHIRQIYEPYHYGSDYDTMLSHKYAIELLESLPIGLITISPHLKEYYEKYHNLNSHLITNGIDPSVFYPTQKENNKSKMFNIISVGNPDHFVKGTRELSKALKLLAAKRTELTLNWNILTGSKGKIDNENIPKNLNIRQITGQDQVQMRKHYSDADIFVNPSLYEGFGLPTIEAMLCGTPVVQVENLGLDHIIDGNDDCILVPVNDVKGLAEAIEKLIDDKALYKRIREGGFEKALRYTTRHQFEMFLSEFQNILGYKFDERKVEVINKNFGYDHNQQRSLDSLLKKKNNYNPLVSVIIPSYNQAEYLREALDSLIAQKYENWEAVVINDGSKDHTEEVMNEYAAKDKRIRAFTKANGGITSALNAGLEKAKGDFFCWLSSDDLFYPDKLELQVKAYESLDESYALVYGSFDILNESETTKEIQKQPLAPPVIEGCEFPEAMKFDFIDGCTIMIRMNVMREVRGFNPGIVHSQDMELWVRIASRGYRFFLLPNKLTIRRVHTAQSSTINMIHCRYDAAWMINYYLDNYHLLHMYRYINLNSEKGIKSFIEHFISRTFNTEANINHPLLQEKFWNWFAEGIKALPVHIQNVLLRNCLLFFVKNQHITYKIKYYVERCIDELKKERVFSPVIFNYSVEGRDFRESNRAEDPFATELFEYGLNLLINSNTPLFAQELYFHNTNKLVDTPYKLAVSAFRYLTQFNNKYRDLIKPVIESVQIPQTNIEAIVLFIQLSFPTISQKLSEQISLQNFVGAIKDVEKYITDLSESEQQLLKNVCDKNPTEPILYYWNGLILNKENKTFEGFNEAWKIFGYNLSEIYPEVFNAMYEWANNLKDYERAYYLSVICGHFNPQRELSSQKAKLLNEFKTKSSIIPELNLSFKEKPKRESSEIVINKLIIKPQQDGNFYFDIECLTPHKKVLKSSGLLPYQSGFEPILLNDAESGKDYFVSAGQVYSYWSNNYNFYNSFEDGLLKRLEGKLNVSVAFISPYTDNVNGGTLVALRMANWLHELGVQVTVYSIRKRPLWFDLKCNFVSIPKIEDLYKAIKEKVIIAHSVLELPELLLHSATNKRIYHLAQVVEDFHYHGYDFKSLMMPKGVFQLLHSLPIGRISVSQHIDRHIQKQYKQKSYLIENGIDLQSFQHGYRKSFTKEITFSTVGNLNRILKGTDDVIDAIEMLSTKHKGYKFNLIVVSNGASLPEQRLRYKGYNFNLIVLYDLSQSEMREVYLKSDFYINASWYEGFGLPSIEAMSCGVPVFQADNKGLDGIVEDGLNCILFQPADPNNLCAKIESVLSDELKIKSIVKNGLDVASKYSLGNSFDSFVNAFERILVYKFNETKIAQLKKQVADGNYTHKLNTAKNILNPKVSVIIPVAKNSQLLNAAINSLTSQDYENWEACIVFNEIDDSNYSFIKSVSKLSPKIKYAKSLSSNYADLLNTGLRNISGEWLTILYPGIIYASNRIKSLVNNVELNLDKKLFYSNYQLYNRQENKFSVDLDSIHNIPLDEYQLWALANNNHVKDFSVFINTNLISELNGFNSKYNTACVYDLLLNLQKEYLSVFLFDNSCAVIDKVAKSYTKQSDVSLVLQNFLRNVSLKELFPKLDFIFAGETKKLLLTILSQTKNKNSLLHDESTTNLLLDVINRWSESITDQELSSKVKTYLANRNGLNNSYVNFYLNFKLDFIKSLNQSDTKTLGTTSEKEEVTDQTVSVTPTVSIILVTYNQIEYTLKCLDSIFENTKLNFEVIIIDNASNDNTCMKLRSKDNIKFIENKTNLGFPSAVNQGLVKSSGQYVLLLNNDTVVTNGWLERLIEIAESDKKIGIVGPISNEVSGLQKDTKANYNSIDEMHRYASLVKGKNKNEVMEFPRVAFLCTLIKKEVIEKIGGLDERFSPGNYEDDDFCLRAQLAGYKTVIAKDVFIHHYGSKSFKANGETGYAARLETNKKLFVEKWGASPDEIWIKGGTFNHTKNLIVSLNADRFIQYFDNARLLISDKEYKPALENLEKAIQHYNTTQTANSIPLADVYNLAGNISLFLNDLESSKKYFEEELKLNPGSSAACFGLGEIFFVAEQYNASKTMFEWAVVNDSSNNTAKNKLGEVNSLLGFQPEHNSLLTEAN